MPTIADLNPLKDVNIGMGAIGTALIIILIAFLILTGLTILIILYIRKKKYFITIPLYQNIGNTPTRIGTFKARIIPIGKAGDKLWYVGKVKKYLPPATLQSAPNEFIHWVRADGEWINIALQDVDLASKKLNVKLIEQDMRSNRLATDKILEQRLLQKGFWEKWGVVIGYSIFFVVIAISMIIIFYQYSKVVELTGELISKASRLVEAANIKGGSSTSGLVPALILILGGS